MSPNSVIILRDIRNCPIERYIPIPLFYRTCFSYSAILLKDSRISEGGWSLYLTLTSSVPCLFHFSSENTLLSMRSRVTVIRPFLTTDRLMSHSGRVYRFHLLRFIITKLIGYGDGKRSPVLSHRHTKVLIALSKDRLNLSIKDIITFSGNCPVLRLGFPKEASFIKIGLMSSTS